MTKESSSSSEARSATRFSGRVANYVLYRPSYPAALSRSLVEEFGIGSGSKTVVADVGSGTGISTRLFLDLGCQTFAVEPNAEMRAAAESEFHGQPRFQSVPGSAESTTLPDASVDCVAAGQAFHWFDQDAARNEFRRILRNDGVVTLFWNSRLTEATPFLMAYEQLLQSFGTDYNQVNHQQLDAAAIEAFFAGGCATRRFPNQQQFDFAGLRGRLLSSSYVPQRGDAKYDPMLLSLRQIFDEHQVDGAVYFDYETELYVGKLG